jgi:hypothetical protein
MFVGLYTAHTPERTEVSEREHWGRRGLPVVHCCAHNMDESCSSTSEKVECGICVYGYKTAHLSPIGLTSSVSRTRGHV